MPREIAGKGLRFSLRHAPCAHICRYCLISESEHIDELRPTKFATWLSEREWIPVMLESSSKPRRLLLKLDVDESNIFYLERASCEEVFAAREREYQESYRATPPLDELCARYGDPTNRRIYMMSRDVEGKWLDLHQRETGASKPID